MTQPSRTILIVDDSPEDRELYRRYLLRDRDYSYTILEASLGRQGLELWQQQRPDLVLLDYRLPDLDGLEFLAQLASPTQTCLPVVVMTGQGNETIAVQAMKAGAQDYLIKGQITPEVFHLAVSGAIEAVQLRTELQQRIERERLVGQITRQIHQFLDLDRILQTTVNQVRQFLNTDRVLVFQLQPDGNGTVVAESVGDAWRSLLSSTIYDPCLAGNYLRLSRPGCFTDDSEFVEDYVKRYRQGQVTVISDIHASDIDPCHIELLAQFQVNAHLVVPILHNDRFWGLLIAHHCAAPRQWQPLEIDLLKELATHLGIALRQAKLYQQSQTELAERKRIEADLRASEERLRSALIASRMGTWDWNMQTGHIQWSDNLEAMFGLEPGQFDGSFAMFVSFLHPDDRDRMLATVERVIATGEDYQAEFRVVYPNGRIRWALSQGKVFYDQNGQPVRMVGNDIDMTDRKQSEIALRDNEQMLRLALAGARQGIWDWDLDTQVLTWDTRCKEIFGLPPDFPVIYEWHLAALHPDDRPRVQTAATVALDEYTEFVEEYRTFHPNGEMRWILARGCGFYDSTGKPYRMSGTVMDITDRKQAEMDLVTANNILQAVINGTDDVIFVKDLEGRYVLANQTVAQWLNRSVETMLGQDDLALFPADVAQRIQADDQRVIQSGEAIVFDESLLRDGVWRSLLSRKYPWRNQQGEMMGVIGILSDITDRKQTEEMVQRIAKQDAFRVALTDALRSLDDPVEVQATASRMLGEYLGVNRVAYFQVRGTDYFVDRDYVNGSEPLRGGYPIDSFGPRLLAAYRAAQVAAAADVAADPNLSPAQRSAYAAIQIAAYIGVPLVKHGEFVAGLAIHTATPRAWTPEEIALAEEVAERTWAAVERARAETALRASHDTFRHLVENSPFGVYVVDANFRLAQVSTGAQKVFANVRPLLGRDFAEVLRILWPEPFASEAIAHFQHTLITGEPYHAPSTVERRQDTEEVESYDWKIERITLPDGSFGIVCHFYDLSERQLLLQREQAARAEAERANRIKDEFLAILSHELRSPLNPILGWAKLLQTRQFDPAKTAEALATIERNAKLQTQLIDDLLDIAKILRGKLSMNTTSVDLVPVIEAAIDTVRAAAVAKDILLHPVLPQMVRVSGDAIRLQQIIWNLLSNAIKFTPIGGRVEIHLEREGNQAKITIRDTGKGISLDFLPHIFESFRQEDASTTRKYGGLGLGLAIVRHLVEAHGGTISADSPGEGQGATFIVQFPLRDPQSEQPTSESASVNALDLTGMRILAVDDELDARELLMALLTQYGAEVLVVASAAEVLANLESFQPNLLINDIGMPEVDGYLLMQQIRALPPEEGGQIPAIALTAYAREEDQQRAVHSGYQYHLTKPLDLDQLVQVMAELTSYPTFGASERD